jgi:hypothetical protein
MAKCAHCPSVNRKYKKKGGLQYANEADRDPGSANLIEIAEIIDKRPPRGRPGTH